MSAESLGVVGALRRARPHVAIARVPVEALGRAAVLASLGGAVAVIAAPIGEPRPLPPWNRRFHRFVLADPGRAVAWGSVGIALGRVAVVQSGPDEAEALRAIVSEVAAMTLRPDIRRRAR